MLLIIVGLYAFLWAKNKEFKNMKQALEETAASTQLPVTTGSIKNKNGKNSTAYDQSEKTRSASTVAPTTSPPSDDADSTTADRVKITCN